MKKQIALFLFTLVLVNSVQHLKKSSEKSRTTEKSKNKKQDSKELTKQMFQNTRSADCVSKQVANQIGGFTSNLRSGSTSLISRDFSWVKKDKWGFGQNSYIFDYLDAGLGEMFVAAAQKIYNTVRKFDVEIYKDYKDPFISDLIDADTQQAKAVVPQSFKENYDPRIFELSVNSVQLKQALDVLKWQFNEFAKDPSLELVQKFDINGDTRLSPRELVLLVITQNAKKYASGGVCYLCFENLLPVIDSMFTYMDCDSDGYISVENLMKYLPKLKRSSPKWFIFADPELGIRNKSVNDFVLVNNSSRKGELNLQEFKLGLLYGFWNRQTTDFEIVDDSRVSLKHLRWAEDGLIDKEVARYKYQLKLKEELEKAREKEKREAEANKQK